MKYLILSLVLCTLSKNLSAQVNTATWGVSDTVIDIVKTTDFGPAHDYIELFNNSNQELQMRWIPKVPQGWPQLWIPNFTDPDSNYTDVRLVDSADFTLHNPVGWENKLIIGVSHQSYADSQTISFKVFPVNYPEDSLWIHFNVVINQGDAYATINDAHNDLNCYVNQLTEQIIINGDAGLDNFTIYNLNGQAVMQGMLSPSIENKLINCRGLQSGTYILQLKNSSANRVVQRKIVFH